jgi:hypothetical protein
MAEYLKITNDDRWKKMNARSDAVFGKIMTKLEILLQHYNCSPISSHGAANSHNDIPTSEPLNVNLSMEDEYRSSTKQIKVPSICEQSLLVEMVTPASDLIEDVMDLPATTTITTLTETTELFTGRNISIDQVEFSLCTESADTLFVTDEESVGQLESTTKPIHLISSQEPQDIKTILEWLCITKPPCLGMMWTGSI